MSGRTGRNGRGRKDATERIRELVALIGSLSRTGDAVTLDAISRRLGISVDDAATMMDIVCQASGEETSGLLISANDEMTEFVLQYPTVHGRPIRLTSAETVALIHALDQAGIDEDDPLRQRLREAFTSREVEETMVRKALGHTQTRAEDNAYQALFSCAHAQVDGREVCFDYQGMKDAHPRPRRASIRTLSADGDLWYVSAIDLDLQQERTFRIDRMTHVRLGATVENQDTLPATPDETRTVRITLYDESLLTMLEWPGLEVIQRTTHGIEGTIVYYGPSSTWLLRRIAAGGGSLVVHDDGIKRAVQSYIASELG